MAVAIIVLAGFFLAEFFKLGGGWKSGRKRRYVLIANGFGMLCGLFFLLADLALPSLLPYQRVLNGLGALSFLVAIGYGIAAFATPDKR